MMLLRVFFALALLLLAALAGTVAYQHHLLELARATITEHQKGRVLRAELRLRETRMESDRHQLQLERCWAQNDAAQSSLRAIYERLGVPAEDVPHPFHEYLATLSSGDVIEGVGGAPSLTKAQLLRQQRRTRGR